MGNPETRMDLLRGELRELNAKLIETREQLARLRQVEEHILRRQRRVARDLQDLQAQRTKASLARRWEIEHRSG